MLTLVDEYTRECLAIDVARKLSSDDVLERLAWLMATRGVPGHIRSDNGPEFTAQVVREWLEKVGVKTLFIEPGSPWENGYVESFNGKLRDELLDREMFYSLSEAKVLIGMWREHYNRVRPHSSLGYRPPAPESIAAGPPSAALRADQQRSIEKLLSQKLVLRGGRSPPRENLARGPFVDVEGLVRSTPVLAGLYCKRPVHPHLNDAYAWFELHFLSRGRSLLTARPHRGGTR
jgi:hypothetical protein